MLDLCVNIPMLCSDLFQGYHIWSVVTCCAEIVKFLNFLYTDKNEKIY